MAENLLFVPAEVIIQTLTSEALEKIGLLWGVEDDLQSLRYTVSAIKAVLLDAEEKQAAGNHAVRDWLGKLEDAIYDADDLLDDVSTEALRRQIMTRENKANQVGIFFSKPIQLYYRYKVADKIKAIRERLDAFDVDRQRFHLAASHVEETRVGGNRNNTHSFVCVEEVIGREDDKKAVIHRLLDSNVDDKVSILPIVAIGGLGKTTLAQLVFNDDQIQKRFELKMWVCVSDPFNVQNVVGKILEAATDKKPEAVEMNTLARKLKEKIDGKKYLLVLDDVWNEDLEMWSRLKVVLTGGARGSRILVTTRTKSVANVSGTVELYSLRGLKEHASWSLFKQMAFEKGQEPEENSSIVAIGKEIVAKCSGVPLAIRTVGSLLRFKNSESEWLSFRNNDLSKLSQNENGIIPTLKLSYDHLPPHLKHCFAYCRLFPKDYRIETSALIQRWIAQGFVKISDEKQCLEDVGNQYFMDLLCRSFFQGAVWGERGNVIECKMHDLMHDLAISVAGSMITILDAEVRNVNEKTRHVSVVCSDIDALSLTTSLCKARSIRTFLGLPSSNNIWGESECEAIFSSCKFLRVLDLNLWNNFSYMQNMGIDILPSSIGMLKHLRYIDLSWNRNLKKLPNSITRLQNLQSLKLTRCENLEELPRDFRNLVNLRHLEIGGCSRLAYMPCGLGQLINLQTLSDFVVVKDRRSRYSSGLRELNSLNNLRGELCIQNLRHGKDDVASECEAANLKEKKHLHTLQLRWSIEGGGNGSHDTVDDEVLLEVLQPQPNLKHLRLEGNFCSRHPSWLLSLTNLVRFELVSCKKCQYLPPLSQLPFLKSLDLVSLDALEYISDSNEFSSSSLGSVPFFPSLHRIWFYGCPNLKGWWRRDSSVEVNSDTNNYVEISSSSLGSVPFFSSLHRIWFYGCPNLKGWRRRDSSVEVNSDTNNYVEIMEHPLLPPFPCLSALGIWNCPMLASMPMFPHLEERLYLHNASWKLVQQTMMMNTAAPQSATSTATTSSSSTPLSKLKSIKLFSIADLEILPEWLKNLTSLRSLRIQDCNRLNSLSPGIQHLTALQDLDLDNCPKLELVNDEDGMQWRGLKSLFSLEFRSLPKLVSLPSGIQHVTTLQRLTISSCENLTAIPEWIHSCTSLQRLKIENCPILLQRCKSEVGEDWPKIAHIRELELQQLPHPDAEVEELAKAQKKPRIWSIFFFLSILALATISLLSSQTKGNK